jgi:hypothetical protein
MTQNEFKELRTKIGYTETSDDKKCTNCILCSSKNGFPYCLEYRFEVNAHCMCASWRSKVV